MNRGRLIDQCKRLIAEAYEEATEMIVAYLEKHPNEVRKTLCREIDPENFAALDKRVTRLQQKRRSEGISGSTSTSEDRGRMARYEWKKATTEVKAELIVEAIRSNPDIARSVIADQETNVHLAKARQDHDRGVQDSADLRHPDRVPLRHASEHAADVYRLTQIRRELFQMAEKIVDRRLGKLQREEGQEIAEEVAIAASRVKAAFSGNTDKELADAIEQWRKE